MKIFVTGATGFIGGFLATRLSALGHEVIALCRSDNSVRAARAAGQVAALGDLGDSAALERTLREHAPDAVVHLAAVIATTRSAKTVDEVNRAGTERLMRAAVAAGVRRFVFASTVVTGDAHGRVLVEDEPLPVETPYGRAKQASEAVLLERGKEGELDPVVVRPSHVYGAGGWFAGLVRDLERGRFRVPGSGENLWDMAHVEDVAEAFALAATAPRPQALYHVVDDTPVTMNQVVDATASALSKKPPGHVPIWLARLVAGRNAIDAAVRSARSSNARLKRDLGWTPRHPSSLEAIPDVVRALAAA